MKRTTTIDEFRSAAFLWRFAYLLLWIAGSAIIGMGYPQIVILTNLVVLPWLIGLCGRSWPIDQIGAAVAAIIVSTVIGPAMLGLAYHPAVGVVSKPTVVGTLAVIILAAMTAGFCLGRWVGRAPA